MRRGIAVLALSVTACFLLLGKMDSRFWMLHIYESLIYGVIAFLLFFSRSRWPYALGILAPSVWILLAIMTNAFGEPMREIQRFLHAQSPNFAVQFVGGMVSLLSVAMIVACGYVWEHRLAKAGETRRTFALSLAIIIAYYGVLVLWFWRTA